MQYTISEKMMWFALAGRSYRYLEGKEIYIDRKRARQIFRQMTARTPDIGTLTENPLRICLSGGMVWLSIYEAADGQMEDACFGEMVQHSMESPLVKATYKGKEKTAFTIEAQQKRAGFAAKTNPLAKDICRHRGNWPDTDPRN